LQARGSDKLMMSSERGKLEQTFQTVDATLNGHNGGPQKGISLMGREYKGHVFDILVKPVHDSNRWTFDAVIHIPQGARDRVTELKATRDFASEAEAETEAVAFVKKWIDDGKVPL
jgi:hypothetical protein